MKLKRKLFKIFMIFTMLISGLTLLNRKASAIDLNADEGTNDTALNTVIQNCLTANLTGSDWQKELDDEFLKAQQSFSWKKDTGVANAWKWDGVAANGAGNAATDPNAIPTDTDGDGYVEVYSAKQFAAAITLPKIKIMKNLDFYGYEVDWNIAVNLSNQIIDGNGHTFYNIGAQKSFIDTMKLSTLQNITFDSVKIASVTEKYLGIVGATQDGANSYANRSVLDHVRVQNSMFFSAIPTYSGMTGGAYVAPIAESKNLKANYVASVNNITYAVAAHTGGAFGIVEHSEIDNSYSVDTTVIAGGNHSGGFVSCSDGDIEVKNSFTNNNVFGNEQTGVFIGSVLPNHSSDGKAVKFENCFTSGTIEGTKQLGGFIGIVEGNLPQTIDFKNCYSTSIVGMLKGGDRLGGFIGEIQSHPATYTFTDCYAAGEVGSIDTDVSATRGNSKVGGFIGTFSPTNTVFKNCYYDKQTTAMREWATGEITGETTKGALDYLDQTNQGANNIKEVKGVLTSDSKKFGAGLASQPNSNYTDYPGTLPNVTEKVGFIGFSGDTYNGKLVSNSNWVYDGGNENEALHNCMYPQLKTFYDSNDAFVRAYSYASVATVHQQVWDTNAEGNPLSRSTYDTVRDLTMRFTLTSYVDNTSKNENVDIKWKKANTTTSLYGKETQIINIFQEIESSKYKRDYWTADKFAPGIEWVTVTFDVTSGGKSATGTRRLRIIPTSNIRAGNDDLDVTADRKYNHAKDAYFAYSTAPRMAINSSDITTGVYPDAYPFPSGDKRNAIQQERPLASGSIQDLFNAYDNKYQVSGEFLTNIEKGILEPEKSNLINVYLYDVKSFKEIAGTGTSEIIYMDDTKPREESAILSPKLLLNGDVNAKKWADKFNGNTFFEVADEGRYLIEYEWILPDGRYMRDSKMIMVQPKDHQVEINVKNMDNTVNNSSMSLSIVSYEHGLATPNRNFGDVTSKADATVDHFDSVDLAFKKVNDTATIQKIQFDITTSDMSSSVKKQTVTVDNVKVNTSFKVPIKYYYSSYEESGKYYAKVVETDRTYTLKYDNANGFYYLTMDNAFEDKETGLTRYDLESDVKVTIFVNDSKAVNLGNATITSETFENDKQIYNSDLIQYKILNEKGQIVKEFSLKSLKEDNSLQLRLPVGKYTIERLDNDKYTLDSILVDNTAGTNKIASFTVVVDGNTEIVIKNVKKNVVIDPEPSKPVPPDSPDSPDSPNSPDSPEEPGSGGVKTEDATKYLSLFGGLGLISFLLAVYLSGKKYSRK